MPFDHDDRLVRPLVPHLLDCELPMPNSTAVTAATAAAADNDEDVVVLSVCAFMSLVFVLYDCLVARRQRIVMKRALASGAIMTSRFPSQVRDQLYKENEGNRDFSFPVSSTRPHVQGKRRESYQQEGRGVEDHRQGSEGYCW
jgi:hypothetical protein